MPGSCMCHRSLTGRMCNNQKYFCSPDKQDIGSLGHLNSEGSDTMGRGGAVYNTVQDHKELIPAISDVFA